MENQEERKIWLEDAVEEHIKNNPNKDSVDICSYFKLRADLIMCALSWLQKDNKVVRRHHYGNLYGYLIK